MLAHGEIEDGRGFPCTRAIYVDKGAADKGRVYP